MTTQTQALNQSMPNQWAQSQLVCFNQHQLSMSTRTQALDRSLSNQWARSQLICFNQDQITSISVIKVESIPTNSH